MSNNQIREKAVAILQTLDGYKIKSIAKVVEAYKDHVIPLWLSAKSQTIEKFIFSKKAITELTSKDNFYPWVLTALICVVALIVFLSYKRPESSAEFGDFLAGFAGTLAFLWLIVSYKMQTKELSLQRKTLQLQIDEFKALAKQGAMNQVVHTIETAEKECNFEDMKFYLFALNGEKVSKIRSTILNSDNPKDILQAIKEYDEITAPLAAFYAFYQTACLAYLKDVIGIQSVSQENFLLVNGPILQRAPYIKKYLLSMEQWETYQRDNSSYYSQRCLAELLAEQKMPDFKENDHHQMAVEFFVEDVETSDSKLPVIARHLKTVPA